MSPVEERVARFARHTSSDLNRHGAKVLLSGASGELRDLVALMGLAEVLEVPV